MSPGLTSSKLTSLPALKIPDESLGILIPFYLNMYYRNAEQSKPVSGLVPPYLYFLPIRDLPD
jgi:hypothetical protein